MPPFTALERFFERLFERPSARLFRTRLQPVQLLHRVERAMETGRLTTADGVLVPETVTVRMNPDDLATFGAAAGELATELADGALRFARAHGYRLRGRPVVELVADERLDAGEASARARFADATPSARRSRGRAADPEAGPAPGAPLDAGRDRSAERAAAAPPLAARDPLARLRILEPHGGDRAVLVGNSPMTIGRGPVNDVSLGDARVSREHARLLVRQGRLVLLDLDSRNGTFVNGTPVHEIVLGLGDEIRIGDTRLIVEGPPG